MQCLKCDSENSADAKFCHRCGNQLEGGEKVDAEDQRKALNDPARRSSVGKNAGGLWRERLWGTSLRKVGSIAVTVVMGLAFLEYFGYLHPKLEIKLNSVTSRDGACDVSGTVTNNTQHHADAVEFTINSIQFAIKANLPAHYHAYREFGRIDLTGTTLQTCQNLVSALRENRRSVHVGSCSMPNVTEGECQGLVSVTVPSDIYLLQK